MDDETESNQIKGGTASGRLRQKCFL